MQLPQFKSDSQELTMMQNKWASILNPLLAQPINSNNFLQDISISTGVNTINHLLGRKMQGWFLVDNNGNATMYRSAALNDKTLTLTSTGPCTISLLVF